MEGETIDGRYRVVSLLGKGGMGSVYEAHQTSTGRRVAVKVINSHDVTKDKMLVTRFQREAKAAGSIETEHIAQVLDSGVDGTTGSPFMVMEFLAGEDLDQLLRRVGPLPVDVAVRIVAQACLGLQKAHDARVMHRDIKPANLFLARRDGGGGEVLVKILDFGIAKIKMDSAMTPDSTGLTRTGSMLGSPLYMSPEQARGIKNIDHRTDIWSLGVVLYRMLTGRTPHEDIDALGDLIIAIRSDAPRPVQDLAPWVPPEVAAAMNGALRFEVADRYQTPAAMLEALEPLLPNGWALEESMLVALSETERAHVAPRLSISQASGERRTAVVRVSTGDGVAPHGPTLDVGTNEGTTQSQTPIPRGPRASRAAIAAGGVLLAAGAVVGIYALRRGADVPPEPQPAALSPQATPAPSPPPPTAEPSATAAVAKTVKLVVVPADATVEVDGVAATAQSGIVEITGTSGSVHKVRLRKGKDETTGDVVVGDSGANPPKLELAVSARPAARPPAGTTAPKPPGPPAGTVAPALPAIKEKFE